MTDLAKLEEAERFVAEADERLSHARQVFQGRFRSLHPWIFQGLRKAIDEMPEELRNDARGCFLSEICRGSDPQGAVAAMIEPPALKPRLEAVDDA